MLEPFLLVVKQLKMCEIKIIQASNIQMPLLFFLTP